MDEFKEFLVITCIFVGICILVLIPIGGIACYLTAKSCEATWKDSGFESRWGFWSDCQIKVEGYWMPANRYHNGELIDRSRSIPHTP